MVEELQQQDSQEHPETPTSNKRIAKNALMLYIRMFLTMIVGLYTSRVVLATLGVEDYGIYGVVGGVVAMMGFLNASMSGATSRFLTFELGRGDKKRLSETFSSALIVHIGIALIVFILAETVGLWFLCNKLVIPAGRMNAAHWVYQCSILSAMLGITQAPYNASIIAHEKMDVYAYVEILNVSLKLLIVYLLVIGNFDKLKLYALLVLAVSVLIMLIYRIYCIRKFKETHFHWIWKKEILKPLLSFSGWDLYGNGCVTARQQGTNFLINIFFGVSYNAASTISTNVIGIVSGLTFNVIQAFRPQIIKNYSLGNVLKMQKLMQNANKYTVLMFGCILIPCLYEMPYLLKLWLVEVPLQTVEFCRIILFSSLIGLINSIVTIGIHATGNIKKLSFISGSVYLSSLPLIYVLFIITNNINMAYYILLLINFIVLLINSFLIKKQINSFNILKFLWCSISAGTTLFISGIICSFFYKFMNESFLRMIVITFSNIGITFLLTYLFLLDEITRAKVKAKVCQRFQL